MTDLSNPVLSALIGSIYDCTLDPSRWDQTLGQVARLLGCEQAILSLNDLRRHTALIKKTLGWEPSWLHERTRHMAEINGVLGPWLLRQPSLDHAFVASRDVPAPALAASPYVRQCLQPQGIVDVAHFFFIATPDHLSELVLFWRDEHGVATAHEIELGTLLLPHLRRALTISNMLDAVAIERNWALGALDALHQGVVLIDERGALLHANPSAQRMLHSGALLALVGGALRARSRVAHQELTKALKLAANESAIGTAGTTICLSDPGLSPVFAHVLPMRGGEVRAEMHPGALAAVFIDPGLDGRSGAAALTTAFGLTPAESRVIDGLAAGRSLSTVAAELGIAGTTVRTHLNHIFLKTGVARQADLMRLVMQATTARPTRAATVDAAPAGQLTGHF